MESLSGYDLSDVRVHYGSAQPAQADAHSMTQGSDIHLGPGRAQDLPHEAWHVVQQKQGRVGSGNLFRAMGPISDDAGLEAEADVMGARAMSTPPTTKPLKQATAAGPIQRRASKSRGSNGRTFVLPSDVKDHILVNGKNGSGFHSVARSKDTNLRYVQQTDTKTRASEAYRADHYSDPDQGSRVAQNKSMFPDDWAESKVVEAVQLAFTVPVGKNEQTRINKSGTTEDSNRTLPPIVNGRVHGKAHGVRIEGITSGGELKTAYPLV
jgi:hypothetical protein